MTDLRKLLEKAAKSIGDHDPALAAGGKCNCLACRTERLAARGWPVGVAGDGSGVRSTTTGSSVERALTVIDPLDGLGERVGPMLLDLRIQLFSVLALAAVVDSHAGDDDVVPGGTGHCACGCGTKCDPRKNPSNRLRSNLAPACYQRWRRWREAYPGVTISDFLDACYRERGESRAKPVAPAAEPRSA